MLRWSHGQTPDTLQLFALDNKKAAKLNNLLVATVAMFLSFVLMALIAVSPSLSTNRTAHGLYILASLAIAAPTVIFALAMANGEASLKMIEDASERTKDTKTPDLKEMKAALGVDRLLHRVTLPSQGHVQRLRRLATIPTLPALPSLPRLWAFPGVSRFHVLPRVDTDGLARVVGEARKLVEGLWRGWRHAGPRSFAEGSFMDEDIMDERLAPVLEYIDEVDEREVLIRMVEEDDEEKRAEECMVAAVTGM